MKRFLLFIVFISITVVIYASTYAVCELPDNQGYVSVHYMRSKGILSVSSQIRINTDVLQELNIIVTCSHRWKEKQSDTNGQLNSTAVWQEEQYVVCNNRYVNIPVNRTITVSEGLTNPPQDINTDYYENFNVIVNASINVSSESSNDYRMVFYAWGRGTYLGEEYERSAVGHAFAYIPEIGYRGFSTKDGEDGLFGVEGEISDHQEFLQYATDSFVVYLSIAQFESVKDKYRQLEQNVPRYTIADYDCTSFTMDLADAAGIYYGNRKLIQWPVSFIKELKKHNPSK